MSESAVYDHVDKKFLKVYQICQEINLKEMEIEWLNWERFD